MNRCVKLHGFHLSVVGYRVRSATANRCDAAAPEIDLPKVRRACDDTDMEPVRNNVPVTLADLRDRRQELLRIAKRHGASNVRVFGSVMRGDASAASDVDFVVSLDEGRSLLDLGGLLMDFRDALGCDVDVVTDTGLRERIRNDVLATAAPL